MRIQQKQGSNQTLPLQQLLCEHLEYGILGDSYNFSYNLRFGYSVMDCLYYLSKNKDLAFVKHTVYKLLDSYGTVNKVIRPLNNIIF
jgi:hypothetical protein